MLSSIPILSNIARILLESVVIFLITTLLVFALIRSIPGEDLSVGQPSASSRSFIAQYFDGLHATLTLNLGISQGLHNSERVIYGLLVTMSLTTGATLLLLLVGIPLGVITALRPKSVVWNGISFVIYLVSVIPIFLLGYAMWLLWLPIPPVIADIPIIVQRGLSDLSELALYVFFFMTMIVVLAIGDGTLTELIRAVREEVGTILDSEYIRAVRANGGSVRRHVAKNLFAPIFTILNLRILYLLGGAVIVESIFTFPGLGLLTVESVSFRDYNLVFSITVISVLLVLVLTSINRILITLIDPRTRS